MEGKLTSKIHESRGKTGGGLSEVVRDVAFNQQGQDNEREEEVLPVGNGNEEITTQSSFMIGNSNGNEENHAGNYVNNCESLLHNAEVVRNISSVTQQEDESENVYFVKFGENRNFYYVIVGDNQIDKSTEGVTTSADEENVQVSAKVTDVEEMNEGDPTEISSEGLPNAPSFKTVSGQLPASHIISNDEEVDQAVGISKSGEGATAWKTINKKTVTNQGVLSKELQDESSECDFLMPKDYDDVVEFDSEEHEDYIDSVITTNEPQPVKHGLENLPFSCRMKDCQTRFFHKAVYKKHKKRHIRQKQLMWDRSGIFAAPGNVNEKKNQGVLSNELHVEYNADPREMEDNKETEYDTFHIVVDDEDENNQLDPTTNEVTIPQVFVMVGQVMGEEGVSSSSQQGKVNELVQTESEAVSPRGEEVDHDEEEHGSNGSKELLRMPKDYEPPKVNNVPPNVTEPAENVGDSMSIDSFVVSPSPQNDSLVSLNECELCDKTFSCEVAVEKHRAVHHQLDNYARCHDCNLMFQDHARLTIHRHSAHPEFQFSPKELNLYPLQFPFEAKHTPVKFFCTGDDCYEVFHSEEFLNIHLHTHGSKSCSLCSRKFTKMHEYAWHVLTEHNKNLGKNDAAFLQTRQYQKYGVQRLGNILHHCTVCEWSFEDKPWLIAHFLHNHMAIDSSHFSRIKPCRRCKVCSMPLWVGMNSSGAKEAEHISLHFEGEHEIISMQKPVKHGLEKDAKAQVQSRSSVRNKLTLELKSKIFNEKLPIKELQSGKEKNKQALSSQKEKTNEIDQVESDTDSENEEEDDDDDGSDEATKKLPTVYEAEIAEVTQSPTCENDQSMITETQVLSETNGVLTDPLTCTTCGSKFRKERTLERHIKMFHGPELKLKCSVKDCDKRFLYPTQLKRHKVVHERPNQHPCPKCSRVYKHKDSLKQHTKEFHTKGSERKFKCQEKGCKGGFPSQSKLTTHMNVHKSPNPLTCRTCGVVFTLKRSLQRHIEQFHPEGSEPKLKCSTKGCDKRFLFESQLKKHMKRHTRQQRFKCNHCGKRFGYQPSLDYHVKNRICEPSAAGASPV